MQNSYLVGLIGTGVGPSLTPAMHMGEGRSQGLDYVYRTIDLNTLGISPDRIGEVLSWARDLGFDAVNVTHPCKQLALAHLDDIDPVAATLGAVNTVLFTGGRTAGFNTDTTGFAHGFAEGGLITAPVEPRVPISDNAALMRATNNNSFRLYNLFDQDAMAAALANHPAMEKRIIVVAGENGGAIRGNW